MVERVRVDLGGGRWSLRGAVFRYGVLARVQAACAAQGARCLAFGFATDHLRLVLEGSADTLREVVRGLKVGNARVLLQWGVTLPAVPHVRTPTDDLLGAVVWAHAAPQDPLGPLASPWTSHRDVLGFRRAPFYDPAPLLARLDPHEVHRACDGAPLPDGWPPPRHDYRDLHVLLRVAGAVLGVLPADRKCFRMFVHLARAKGHPVAAMSEALVLTTRRVRQLAAEQEPWLPLALRVVDDPLLCRVP